MENERSIVKLFNSPTDSKINSLPLGVKSYWYYNQDDVPIKKVPVLKRGWLERQASRLFGSKKPKWVVLLESGILCYDDQSESKQASRMISLDNKVVSQVNPGEGGVTTTSSSSSGGNNVQKYFFQISPVELNTDGKISTSNKNVDLFGTSSEEERKEWVKCLKRAMYGKVGGAIFGGSLEETLAYERNRNKNRMVPEIVQSCAEFIEEHGLDVDGIFRLTGKKALVCKLQEIFDRGERPTLLFPPPFDDLSPQPLTPPPPIEEAVYVDVHTIASFLKLYLLELPEPIVPVDFYVDIMTIVTREYELDPHSSINKISSIIDKFPMCTYNLLRYICELLKKVGDNECNNRMSYQNLAKVFCNAVLEPEDNDPALLMGTADNRAKAVTIMVTYLSRIFKEKWKFKDEGSENFRLSKMVVEKRRSDVERAVKSWDSLLVDDGKVVSCHSLNQSNGKRMSKQILDFSSPNLSIKSLEVTSDKLRGSEMTDGKRASSSSTLDKTINSFLDLLPHFGSSVTSKSTEVKHVDYNTNPTIRVDTQSSSLISQGELEGILRIRKSEAQNVRRSSSVKNLATEEKLLMLDKLYGNPNQPFPNRKSNIPDDGGVRWKEGDPCNTSEINFLIGVHPESLSGGELMKHFLKLQSCLVTEYQKVGELQSKLYIATKLEREMMEQREAREQAVARVVDLQAQLERYFLKYGPL